MMFEYSKKHQPKGLGVISHGDSTGLLNAGAHGLVDVAFRCARISWQLLYTSIKQSSRGLALWKTGTTWDIPFGSIGSFNKMQR